MADPREDGNSLSVAGGGRSRPAGLVLPPLAVDGEHRLQDISFAPSPNADERPDPADISLIVVHAISLPPNGFGGPWIEDLFLNRLDPHAHPYFDTIRELKVSAHLLIRRHGELLQFVPFDRRAWHAGDSSFAGRSRCNDFSIGIELEGSDDVPFESAQYRQLARVCQALLRHYPGLAAERIVGHSDIAPGRKTDPGPHFDWTRLYHELRFWEAA